MAQSGEMDNREAIIGREQLLLSQIEQFLQSCGKPVLSEPGEPLIPLQQGSYSLELCRDGVLLESWGEGRVLRRRLLSIRKSARRRLELDCERFPRKRGTLSLADMASAQAPVLARQASSGMVREHFRRWCERLHPEWRFECLSAAPDLEHSLSPRFPRALLQFGKEGICAIAAMDENEAEDVFSFGLIWLDHCRNRWASMRVRTLLIIVPECVASRVALRLLACSQEEIRYRLVAYTAEETLRELAPRSWGNLETHFEIGQSNAPGEGIRALFAEVAAQSAAECVEDISGALTLELRGLLLARASGSELRIGVTLNRLSQPPTAAQLIRLAGRVAAIRCADSPQPRHSLYRIYPERWLESVVRREIRSIDPTLSSTAVRRQVSGSLGPHHTRTDLVALDETGRLVVIEVKVEPDIQLPAQALDYYVRLKLHLQRGDLNLERLFPGRVIRAEPPRLLLVAPALSFHSTNETVMRYVESSIQVRQIGIALEWRKQLRVVFQHPFEGIREGGRVSCPATFSSKSVRHLPR
jgi:hypothetical protein